mmetsp:Transcript_6372/g.27122  ORF Transcript_6372/g.27122 Transcript_6372/m.27122 type:complete len:323 (-) Transcript_6372:2350-3318(-)
MPTYIHRSVQNTFTQLDIPLSRTKILIAVSGGKDSLCLMKIIKDFHMTYQWEIAIVHCNHSWRNDATQNAYLVQMLAKELGFTFYLAINHLFLSTESQMRQWRYFTFLSIANQHQYNLILTAHTSSDKIETMLHNLSRGTGIDGIIALSSIKRVNQEISIIRPLLGITAQDSTWFCHYFSLPIWADTTNVNLVYTRNRIRQELIPYLYNVLNPQLDSSIGNFLDQLTISMAYLNKYSYLVYSTVIHPHYYAINSNAYNNLDSNMKSWIIRIFLKMLSCSLLKEEIVKKILQFLNPSIATPDVLYLQSYILIRKQKNIYICKN